MVKKLYQENVYIKEWDATITEIIPINNKIVAITLDQTAFFPEGGGQSCDLGLIDNMEVTNVQEDGAEVVHHVLTKVDNIPTVGQSVHCQIDWSLRFDNMQRHCGEHILSGVLNRMYGGVNRGFHMGSEYMTIDISLENNPNITELTYEMVMDAELEANEVIWSDLPITVHRFKTREKAELMPLRKHLDFDEDISVVLIGDKNSPADCVACCGTHPKSTGQVGLIKIFKVEKNKDMFRIYLDAGKRALQACRLRHDILHTLCNKYSSSVEDFPEKIKTSEAKLTATKTRLNKVTQALINKECQGVDKLLSQSSDSCVVYKLDTLSMDDVFNMSKYYMGKISKLLLLYSIESTSFVLVSSGDPKCGKLVKEYASYYNGKGGGNDVSARAIFTNEEDAMLFADLLKKHLK